MERTINGASDYSEVTRLKMSTSLNYKLGMTWHYASATSVNSSRILWQLFNCTLNKYLLSAHDLSAKLWKNNCSK